MNYILDDFTRKFFWLARGEKTLNHASSRFDSLFGFKKNLTKVFDMHRRWMIFLNKKARIFKKDKIRSTTWCVKKLGELHWEMFNHDFIKNQKKGRRKVLIWIFVVKFTLWAKNLKKWNMMLQNCLVHPNSSGSVQNPLIMSKNYYMTTKIRYHSLWHVQL